MEVKVHLRNLRTAPRKVRQVADLVRGKKAEEAATLLSFTVNKPAGSLEKLLKSAIATALKDFKLQESRLYISRIMVDEGPKLKRSHPMSRGRAYPIMKRTSHITLVLDERAPKAAKTAQKGEAKKKTI